jgi:hypothetical protein
MKNSMAYRLFVFSFLLLFSFFHVGFAAVEYLCSMGMEMEAPVCSSCHSELERTFGQTIIINNGNSCCNAVVTKTETIDTYIFNQSEVLSIIKHALTSDFLDLSPEETHIVNYLDFTTPDLPLFNLHGISTSIQYSSFLR